MKTTVDGVTYVTKPERFPGACTGCVAQGLDTNMIWLCADASCLTEKYIWVKAEEQVEQLSDKTAMRLVGTVESYLRGAGGFHVLAASGVTYLPPGTKLYVEVI